MPRSEVHQPAAGRRPGPAGASQAAPKPPDQPSPASPSQPAKGSQPGPASPHPHRIPIEFPLDPLWIPIGFLLDSNWIPIAVISVLDSYWIHIGFLMDYHWIHDGLLLDSIRIPRIADFHEHKPDSLKTRLMFAIGAATGRAVGAWGRMGVGGSLQHSNNPTIQIVVGLLDYIVYYMVCCI
jgi:hypothetical protein